MKINQLHCSATSPVFFIYCTKIYPELSCITRLEKLLKVVPLKLFYYQTFLKLGVMNIHDMDITKMQ